MSTLLLWLFIRGYQLFVSPLFSGHCRHDPTCSQYALIALGNHAPIKSIWLTIKRISRCHPWGTSGFEPVPPHHNFKQEMNVQISGKCVAPGEAQGYIGVSNLSADPGILPENILITIVENKAIDWSFRDGVAQFMG